MDTRPASKSRKLHTQSYPIRPKTVSSFLTKAIHDNQSLRREITKNQKGLAVRQPRRHQVTWPDEFTNILAKQHTQWCETYEQNMQRQKKRCEEEFARLKNMEKKQERPTTPKTVKKYSFQTKSNLFIEQFDGQSQPVANTCPTDWNDILLGVSKQRQSEVRIKQGQFLQPYQKLLNKFQNLNKQNYSVETVRNIQHCKQVKHMVTSVHGHSHNIPRYSRSTKSLEKLRWSQSAGNRIASKTSLLGPSKQILQMCNNHKNLSKIIKRTMDGFQIYCGRFKKELDRKRSALAGALS